MYIDTMLVLATCIAIIVIIIDVYNKLVTISEHKYFFSIAVFVSWFKSLKYHITYMTITKAASTKRLHFHLSTSTKYGLFLKTLKKTFALQ